jgi:hypothetical protein
MSSAKQVVDKAGWYFMIFVENTNNGRIREDRR